jgi:hypothetical protein
MNKNILERYSHTADGRCIISITAGKVSDLYNSFDRHTPYVRKELNQDLVDYITDSASELGRNDFLIHFNLLEPVGDEMKKRISTSINSYFIYLKTIEITKLRRIMHASLIYLAIGIVFLFLSIHLRQLAADESMLSKLLTEGLTVAAWVSLWQALATFLINWTPYRRRIKLYQHIACSPVDFIEAPATAVQSG